MQTPILVKLKMRGIYKTILLFIGILIVIISIIGILYLFYDRVLDPENDIEVKGSLSINYVTGKKFAIDNSKLIKFSVSNNSDEVNYYNINFSKIRGNGVYHLYNNDVIVMEGELKSIDEINTNEISIDAGETKEYILEIVNNKKDTNLEGTLNIFTHDAKIVTFADIILQDNPISTPSTTVGIDASISNEGLIKSTDDMGVTYYFRGDVQNNYVSFGNLLWRIVRINGDGTVRLVLDSLTSNVSSYYETGAKDFNYRDSSLDNYLKTWLEDNLQDQIDYIATTTFCNDISHDDDGNYLSYTRIYTNKIPTFNCLANSLNNNIGVLTIDELVLAGASPTQANTKFYLYNSDINNVWYTMSGARSNGLNVNMFMFDNYGKIRTDIVGNLYRGVRPVINIIKNVEVTGNGTKTKPYVIL